MKKMTKVLALVLALAMCLALCACGKGESKDTAGDKKTFIMGVDPEYPPFSYLGDDGKFTGFDVEICQAVYMPIREDAVSRAKLQEFEQYVEKSGKKTVAGKFHKIHVPMVTGMKRMEHFPQELLWGDLGDFVRGMLKGQRGIWES